MNIIATTGFHRSCYYAPDHFRFRETAEVLASRMVDEVTQGMMDSEGSPSPKRTDIRAGMIKFATEYHVIDADAQKEGEAAAIAHHETGAPILTHTERGTCGKEQVELMEAVGSETFGVADQPS